MPRTAASLTIRLLATTMLMVCGATAAHAADYVMMKIGDSEITAGDVERQWQRLFPEGQAPALDAVQPEMRQNFLRGIMVEHVLYDEAKKSGLEEDLAVKQALEEARRTVLVREFLDRKSGQAISDSAIDNAYNRMVALRKNQNEIRVRHILLHTEEEARDVHDQLANGAAFDTLAEKYSKDPASAEQGGDLGFLLSSEMAKPFADAAFALKKGAISAPVKTTLGWHIIRVDDVRKATIPTLAEAREELRTELQEQALNSYVEQLIKQAGIVVMDESGDELGDKAAAAKPAPAKTAAAASAPKPATPPQPAKPAATAPVPTPVKVSPPTPPKVEMPPKQQAPAPVVQTNTEKPEPSKAEEKKPEADTPATAKPATKFDPNDPNAIPEHLRDDE